MVFLDFLNVINIAHLILSYSIITDSGKYTQQSRHSGFVQCHIQTAEVTDSENHFFAISVDRLI